MLLKDTNEDHTWLDQSAFKQWNYNKLVQNRPGNKKGGGIVITYRKPYKTIQVKEGHKPTRKYAICKIIIKTKPIHILGLYHPLPNVANQTTNSMFLDDLTNLLMEKIPNRH